MKEVERNISTLSNMKEEMLSAGFNASFPEMLANTKRELVDEEIASDLPKQLRSFREFANLKRYTLNRTRVALASHKILYNMMQRGHVYSLAEHLPYNGQYLYDLVYLGEPAVRAYNSSQSLLSRRKEDPGGEYTVVVSHNDQKETVKLESNQDLDAKVKRIYGEEATILSISRRSKEAPLVRNRSTRVAVASAYAKLAAKTVYAEEDKVSPKMNDAHSKYAELLARRGLPSDMRVDLLERREELEDELYSKGLLTEEMGTIKLDPKVVESIMKKRAHYNKATIRAAEQAFAMDVLHYFMAEPKRVRSSYPLFSGVSTDIDERYSFLGVLDMENPHALVEKKLKLEAMVPMSGKQLGAAFMHLSGKSADWCAETFKVPASEVKEASTKLAPYMRQSSLQAKKFLEAMG